MKNYNFNIDYVSKLLGIPKSTLRFWEEKNLIQIKRDDNGYRVYSTRDIINIADIMSYKDLGIKISDIQDLSSNSLISQEKFINESLIETQKQINNYYKILDNLNNKKKQLQKLSILQKNEYTTENIQFDTVVEFNIHDDDLIKLYSQNTSLYIRYYNSTDMDIEKRGIIVNSSNEKNNVLWTNNKEKFIVFMVKEIVNAGYKSNSPDKLKKINSSLNTGIILLEYLTTALDNDDIVDYYKAHLEIK